MTLKEQIEARELADIKELAEGELDYVTYYVDAEEVYATFRDEIWDILVSTAEYESPGLTPISLMNYSRATYHEQFIRDLVNYAAMLIAGRIIEEIKQSKEEELIQWVHKNYSD
jgi:hypothetical protein